MQERFLEIMIKRTIKLLAFCIAFALSLGGVSAFATTDTPEWVKRANGETIVPLDPEEAQKKAEFEAWQETKKNTKVPILLYHHITTDEFTNEELMSRCGQYVTVRTDDNVKAADIIKSMGIEDVEINGNTIRIEECLDRTAEINKKLVTAGIAVNELHITNISLEDYYLSLTGGKRND